MCLVLSVCTTVHVAVHNAAVWEGTVIAWGMHVCECVGVQYTSTHMNVRHGSC